MTELGLIPGNPHSLRALAGFITKCSARNKSWISLTVVPPKIKPKTLLTEISRCTYSFKFVAITNDHNFNDVRGYGLIVIQF